MCKKQQDLPIISEIDQDLRFLHTPPPHSLMRKTKTPHKPLGNYSKLLITIARHQSLSVRNNTIFCYGGERKVLHLHHNEPAYYGHFLWSPGVRINGF